LLKKSTRRLHVRGKLGQFQLKFFRPLAPIICHLPHSLLRHFHRRDVEYRIITSPKAPGKLSGSFQTFVPHSVQPGIRTVRPLSAALSYPLSSPVMSSTSSAFTDIDSVWVVPEKRWQSLQWQA
jgi:hypothetical protein